MGALFILFSVPFNVTLVEYTQGNSISTPAIKFNLLSTNKNYATQCDSNSFSESVSTEIDPQDASRNKFKCEQLCHMLPVIFYTGICIGNLLTFKLAKEGINYCMKYLIRSSSYNSSLWILLVFKFLNTLIIDYQPGSACAGQLFNDQYNAKLAFFKAFHDRSEMFNSFNSLETDKPKPFSFNSPNFVCGTITEIKEILECYTEWSNVTQEAMSKKFTEDKQSDEFQDLIDSLAPGESNYLENILSSIWFQTNNCDTDPYLDLDRQTASALFQVIYIQIFLSNGIFSNLESMWNSSNAMKPCLFVLILLASLSTQVVNHMAYFKSSNIGLHLLFLLLFAPGSVLLEWVSYRFIKAYTERCFQLLIAPIRYFSAKISEDMI